MQFAILTNPEMYDIIEREDIRMKGNSYRKDYNEDKFARAFYCQHARLNQLRSDKKQSRRKTRRKNKNFYEDY